jgi:hypothetical protein
MPANGLEVIVVATCLLYLAREITSIIYYCLWNIRLDTVDPAVSLDRDDGWKD